MTIAAGQFRGPRGSSAMIAPFAGLPIRAVTAPVGNNRTREISVPRR